MVNCILGVGIMLFSQMSLADQITEFGPTPKQTLVLENELGGTINITLWNDLTTVLDRTTLIQADVIEPVIIAVGSLMVSLVNGNYVCSSSSATRVAVNPQIPEAYNLATHFGVARNPVAELAVQFATAEQAAADAEDRTRTIAELMELYHAGTSVEAKYCCGGIINSVENRSPWYYTACSLCLRKCSTWRGTGYWCPEHWEISEEQIRIGYKIQLTLRDFTGEASFIIFGAPGNVLTRTTAPLLAQRYPHRSGQLPPELGALIGQYFRFEVKMPMVPSSGVSNGEFRVLRVFPNDNPEVQQPALPMPPLAMDVTATMGSTHHSRNPQVSQPNNQLFLNVPSGNVSVSPPSCSGAVPSRSAKGKEKVSSSAMQDLSPVFRIGEAASEVPSGPANVGSVVGGTMPAIHGADGSSSEPIPSSSAKGKEKVSSSTMQDITPVFRIGEAAFKVPSETANVGLVVSGAIPTVHVAENQDIATDNTIPVSQAPSLSPSQMVPKTPLQVIQASPMDSKAVIAGAFTSAGNVAESGCSPMPLSPVPKNEASSLISSSLEMKSNVVSSLGGNSEVPQSTSPSTKLLASPLARVKLEKLEVATPKKDNDDAQGSGPFTIGDSTTAVRASKRTPVKRRLYDA